MKNLQILDSKEMRNINGGWLNPAGVVFGVLYACYELGYSYGKDSAERERRNQ